MELPKCYISAPISGVASSVVAERFNRGIKYAELAGFEPMCPLDLHPEEHPGVPCPSGRMSPLDNHSEACHLKADVIGLMQCQAILMMDGWTGSWGCRLELNLAVTVGIDAYEPIAGTPDRFGRLKRLGW